SFDCVIIWRLFHHIGSRGLRLAILSEAARVARRRVLVSFHHLLSFTALRKILQRTLGRGGGHAMTHWQLERQAGACGLRLVATRSFRKYVSINWFALLAKETGAR